MKIIEELKALWKSSKAQSTVFESESEEADEERRRRRMERERMETTTIRSIDDEESEEEEEEAMTKFMKLSKEQRARLMLGFK